MSTHTTDDPTAICTYRVKPGSEEAFLDLIRRHWPTLRKLDLATADPPLVYRGTDRERGPVFYEIFSWKDARTGPATAHESPQVMAVWEPMGGLCEERCGRPGMEFPHVSAIDVNYDEA